MGKGQDFDRGLRGNEESLAAMVSSASGTELERMQSQHATKTRSRRCSECGESEWSGAMFTTMAGGSVCDDCF